MMRMPMRTTIPKPTKQLKWTTGRPGTKRTAQNIELYSSAYRDAWNHISALLKREHPNVSLLLHASSYPLVLPNKSTKLLAGRTRSERPINNAGGSGSIRIFDFYPDFRA